MGLDAPDVLGTRYLVGYTRHWRNDRLILHNTIGYGSAPNQRHIGNNIYVNGQRRQRITGDVTLAFDFIGNPRHALRVGAGPSLWYRKDQKLRYSNFTMSPDGTVSTVETQWNTAEEVNYGFNVLVEYEVALTHQWLLRGNIKFASLKNAGPSTLYGGGIGYRLYRQ